MAVSSNTLFHYTDKFETLCSIFENGFIPSYCMEAWVAIPMVSFCDTPLAQARYYIENYGNYAIGMTKDWGIRHGMNPVLYVEENSILNAHIRKAITAMVSLTAIEDKHDGIGIIREYFIETIRYSKPYQGEMIRDGIKSKNYKFYDEREWRYIRDVTGSKDLGLSREEYKNFKSKNKKPHFPDDAIKMKSKDIKYIILNDESEIPKLFEFLNNTTHLGSPNDIKILFTKIILRKNIIEDI
ncbi:MAG: hypothetical protein ACI8ZM_005230 [Crocinitomix sp.]|jgi:hypothetical protein